MTRVPQTNNMPVTLTRLVGTVIISSSLTSPLALAQADGNTSEDFCSTVNLQQPPSQPVTLRYGLTGGGEEPLALLWSDPDTYPGNGSFYKIKPRKFAPNDRMIAAQSGHLDAGSITLPALVMAARVGIPIKAVASVVETNPTDNQGAFAVLKDSGITDIKQLKGKRISIMGPNTITEYWVKSALKRSGVKQYDVSYVSLPLPANEQALRNGQIEVAWLARQFLAAAEKKGDISILTRPMDMTNQAHPTTLAFFTEKFINDHPEAYCAWRQDYSQAVDNWIEDRQDLYQSIIDSEYVTPASANAGPDGGRSPGAQLSLSDINATIEDMTKTGFLPPGKAVKATDFIQEDYALTR